MSVLDASTTALVLIDLQRGILALPTAPRSAADVLACAIGLARRFRAAGALIVLVHVAYAPDFADAPPGIVDQPTPRPADGASAGWSDLADGLAAPGDLVIAKRHWGAFHGTELDLQLRRRGIRTLVIGGIATNFGVESTVRLAWEHAYHVVVAEDACTSVSAEMHAFSIRQILPRLARVAAAADIVLE